MHPCLSSYNYDSNFALILPVTPADWPLKPSSWTFVHLQSNKMQHFLNWHFIHHTFAVICKTWFCACKLRWYGLYPHFKRGPYTWQDCKLCNTSQSFYLLIWVWVQSSFAASFERKRNKAILIRRASVPLAYSKPCYTPTPPLQSEHW